MSEQVRIVIDPNVIEVNEDSAEQRYTTPPVHMGEGRVSGQPIELNQRVIYLRDKFISSMTAAIRGATAPTQDLLSQVKTATKGAETSPKLQAQLAAEESRVKAECLAALYASLQWLTENQETPDAVLDGKLKRAFDDGTRAGLETARKARAAEQEVVTTSPLAASLRARGLSK